ncbi:unnamed protein product [Prunus armeniaca]|uniref:Uncharacterized protein n=1 Tax=Prunus armeniaca TaxID=36596 RepID=A0A6J5TPU5_PRUAR|nr:unnamed protein product [Prunus armeniaca]CAB4296653.1 unnamed protein product [Prunus armeniaca]
MRGCTEEKEGAGKRTKEKTESARQNKPVGWAVVVDGWRAPRGILPHPYLSFSLSHAHIHMS